MKSICFRSERFSIRFYIIRLLIFIPKVLQENAFLYDVMGDVRKMLPYIQDSFAKLNKTNELIEDYERCDF